MCVGGGEGDSVCASRSLLSTTVVHIQSKTTPMPHPLPSKCTYLCGGAMVGSPEGGGWGPMRPVVRSWPAPRLIPLEGRRDEGRMVGGRMVGGRGTGEREKKYLKDY